MSFGLENYLVQSKETDNESLSTSRVESMNENPSSIVLVEKLYTSLFSPKK